MIRAATGQGPTALFVADLNHDGLSDVLVASGIDNSLNVYIQESGKGLPIAPTATYPTGRSPSAIAVADLDGDGWPEVLVTNSAEDSLSTFQNLQMASGALLPGTLYQMIPTPIAVAAADVDGDGKADVVVSSSGDFPQTILRNDGSGALMPGAPLFGGKLSYGVALAALSSTARPDLVIPSAQEDVVRLFANDGSGGFAMNPRDLQASWGTPVAIAAAALNLDDRVDLLVANYTTDQVTVLLNQGAYAFQSSSYPTGRHPVALAVGDLNHDSDGLPDFVVACQDHVGVWLNTGSGYFAPASQYPTGETLKLPVAVPQAVAIADVNGDSKNELLIIDRLNSSLLIFMFEGKK